jgi:hypothetical protein
VRGKRQSRTDLQHQAVSERIDGLPIAYSRKREHRADLALHIIVLQMLAQHRDAAAACDASQFGQSRASLFQRQALLFERDDHLALRRLSLLVQCQR